MDFVRSYFGTNEPLTSFKHFFPHFLTGCAANQEKSEEKSEEKSVQLVRASSFRSDFLQNSYFSELLKIYREFSPYANFIIDILKKTYKYLPNTNFGVYYFISAIVWAKIAKKIILMKKYSPKFA